MSDPLELRVVSGSPDDAELAAVVTVLLAASHHRGPAAVPGGPRSRWGDPVTLLTRPGTPEPGGWAARRL